MTTIKDSLYALIDWCNAITIAFQCLVARNSQQDALRLERQQFRCQANCFLNRIGHRTDFCLTRICLPSV